MTIFSVSLYDDDYNKWPLHQLCIESWERLQKQIPGSEIKIIGTDSDLYKEFMEIPNPHIHFSHSKAVQADCFRMFCLSKLPESIYLDMDVFVSDKFKYKKGTFLRNSFWHIQNDNDCELFRKIFERYLTGDFIGKQDKFVFNSFYPDVFIEEQEGISHLYKFDNRPNAKILFTDDEKVTFFYKNDKTVTCVSKNKFIPYSMNLYGDKKLIEYISFLQERTY